MKQHNFDVWTKDEMRFFRREAIQRHLWIVQPVNSHLAGRLDNLTLVVRLYERQLYGLELRAYKYYEYHH